MGWLAERELVPSLVASRVRHELAARGFGHARFHVARIDLHHLWLSEVELTDGVYLGDVELDAGLSMLWHDRATRLMIRKARVSSTIFTALNKGSGASTALPFQQIRLEDCILVFGDHDAEVAGTITLEPGQPPRVDLHARLATFVLGTRVIHEVEVTARDAAGEIELCVRARDAGIGAEACSHLQPSLAAIAALRELTTKWTASAPDWNAHGDATFAWRSGSVMLLDGRIEALMPSHNIRLVAQVAGSLAALEVHGNAEAAQLELGPLTLRRADLPFSLTIAQREGALDVTALAPLVMAAERATTDVAGTSMLVVRPSLTLHEVGHVAFAWPTAILWSAAEARIGNVRFTRPSGAIVGRDQTVAWRGSTGPAGLVLGHGEVAFRVGIDSVGIERGHVHGFGGEVSIAPVVARPGQPLELVLKAHRVELARVLTMLGHDGSGRLDGDLALRLSPGGGFTATGSLHMDRLQLHDSANTLEARGVSAPFALHGNLQDGSARVALLSPLVVTAADVTLSHGTSSAFLSHPTVHVGVVPRTLQWQADAAHVNGMTVGAPSGTIELAQAGVQTVMWNALTGPWPLRAEAGVLVMRLQPRRLGLVTGHLHVGAGELTLAPSVARTDRPIEIVMHVRGVELARVLATFGERVRGTGLLDGDLTLHVDEGGSSVAGSLRARAPGELRVSDPAWLERASAPIKGVALQQRLLGTLADFEYADLGIVINPRGIKPELRLTTRGRGKLTPQDLDLVINLNGVRDAMEHVADHSINKGHP